MKYFRTTPICFFITYLLCATHTVNAFWGSDYDEPPPIIRTEPPNAQEIKKANIEQKEVKSTEVRQSDFNDIAKKEAHSLAKLLQLDEQMTRDLTGLFFYKYNQMSLAKNDNEKAHVANKGQEAFG